MTHEDELAFLAKLQERANVRVLRNRYRDSEDPYIKALRPVTEAGEERFLSLINATNRPALRFSREASGSVNLIDLAESEALEFSRCYLVENWVASGRFWFEERSLDGPKAPGFISWARGVIDRLRRSYEKAADGRYVGPDAAAQAKAGRLQLGPPAPPPADELKRRIGLA